MRKLYLFFLAFGHLLYAQTYFPPKIGNTWETTDPASLGYCPDKMQALTDYLEGIETKSFLLLKDGKIVLESYFDDGGVDKQWSWYSAGKSLMATLVGIAQEESLFKITDTTSKYLGEGWTSLTPEQEEKITIRHQLTMTSGLDETEFFCTDPACLTYVADAGNRWVYHNGPYTMLKAVIDSTSGVNINTYTNTRIKSKIGMGLLALWVKVGYNNFFFSTARDMARFGWLIANDGVWDGTTVLGDIDYINAMRTPSQTLNPSYGYLWWLNGQSSFIGPDSPASFPGPITPKAPADMYSAAGSQGQFISISPSTGLMVIRQGTSSDESLAPVDMLNEIWGYVMDLPCDVTGTAANISFDVTVFPNPNRESYLHVEGFETFNYSLYSGTGELCLQGISNGDIPIQSLSKGIYFLTLDLDGYHLTKKIVRE